MKGRPQDITFVWMATLGLWSAYLMLPVFPPLNFELYSFWRGWLSGGVCIFALGCLAFFGSALIFDGPDSPHLNGVATGLLLFWALFPPIWFFVEYYAVASQKLAIMPVNDLTLLTNQAKTFADFSAKIWAAFLVVYGLTTQAQVKRREEQIRKKEKEEDKARKAEEAKRRFGLFVGKDNVFYWGEER